MPDRTPDQAVDPTLQPKTSPRRQTLDLLGREFPHLRSEYGLGVALYFVQLRLCFALLLVCTVAAGVSMDYYRGAGGRMEALMRVSLGNAAADMSSASAFRADELPLASVGVPDAVYSGAFALGLALAGRRLRALARGLRHEQPSAKTFTVWVRGLPARGLDEAAVREFFSARFGEVVGVSLPMYARALLRARRAVARATAELEAARAFEAAAATTTPARRLWMRPSAVLLSRDARFWAARLERAEARAERAAQEAYEGTGSAFVTFAEERAALRAAHAMRLGFAGEMARRLARFASPCTRAAADWLGPPAFRGCTLRVQAAPHPANVNFGNLRCTRRARVWRSAAGYLLSAGLVGGGVVVTLMLESVSRGGDGDIEAGEGEHAGGNAGLALMATLVLAAMDRVLVRLLKRSAAAARHLTKSGQRAAELRRLCFMRLGGVVTVTFVVYRPWLVARWFGAAGGAQAVMGVMLVNYLLFTAARALLVPAKRRARAALAASRGQLLADPEEPRARLDLARRYSLLYCVCGVALFYGSFLPLLFPLAALAVALLYVGDLHNLLHEFRRPPRLDDPKMALAAHRLFLPLVVFHAVMACIAYQRACRTDSSGHYGRDYFDDGGQEMLLVHSGTEVCAFVVFNSVAALWALRELWPAVRVVGRVLTLPCRCLCFVFCRPGTAARPQLTPEGSTIADQPHIDLDRDGYRVSAAVVAGEVAMKV